MIDPVFVAVALVSIGVPILFLVWGMWDEARRP